MSLEAAITANTAALEKLIAVTGDLLNLRNDAFEKVGAAVKATSTKGKDKEDAKANISSSPEDRKNPEEGAAGNPYEGIKELIAAYLAGAADAGERDRRKPLVKQLLNHSKIKKEGVTDPKSADDIKESAIQLFKDCLALLTVASGYTSDTSRDEERDARIAKVNALLNHEKIKHADVKTGECVADVKDTALFADQIEKLKAKGDITQPKPASDDLI